MNCEAAIAWNATGSSGQNNKFLYEATQDFDSRDFRHWMNDLMKFWKRFLAAGFAAAFFVPGAGAQSTNHPVQNRLLLIFDTSSAMKKRLPAEEKTMGQISYTLYGQFRPGDSVGVWTFSHNLRTGDYPLQTWMPGQMPTTAAHIMDYLKHQRYEKTTSFDDLVPTLNEVVRSSERLTTIIFCDGEGEVRGLPDAATINGVFKRNDEVMKKAREPFVIVLRSQLGRYVGCTINRPGSITLPAFPPLPPPPQPALVRAVAPAPEPAPQPEPVAPPLVIVGTNVETNLPLPQAMPEPVPQRAMPAPAPAPAVPMEKNPPEATAPERPPQAGIAKSSDAVAVPALPAPASARAAPMQNTNSLAPAVASMAPPAAAVPGSATGPGPSGAVTPDEISALSKIGLMAIGAGGMAAAALLIYVVTRLFRRRESPSLITESLKKS